MRRISTLVLISLTVLFGANALDTTILVFDRDQCHADSSTVSEDSARLLLEHRMKLADESVLGLVDDTTADYLNQFGGERSPLFGIPEGRVSPRDSLIILEGVDGRACKWDAALSSHTYRK